MRKPEPSSEIQVKVNPRSSRNKIEVIDGAVVHVWTTAPPTDGQANAAVCDLIAKSAKVPKTSVSVISGTTSRFKKVRLVGLTLEDLLQRLGN